ncbi:WecB/TagA/CpsF family glycosyltransferase [Acetomicrobium sp.]|uniref:WecB/TagA/CpsF family glycosyltransferase n=1 Tax=Acetomicrobium sp. TaxID=1872099 RepID=UPI002B25B225|nr:WecB/TagA/CpsF family glycosyltransferase [Acetomicrobium sp.]
MGEAYLLIVLTALGCLIFEKATKKRLSTAQWDYTRDVLMVASVSLLSISIGSRVSSIIVAYGIVFAVAAMGERLYPSTFWPFLKIALAFAFAFKGPQINFLSLGRDSFYYLSSKVAVIATATWLLLCQSFLREVDEISGLSGHLMAITWVLLWGVSFFLGQDLKDAMWISFTGILLCLIFWSRIGHTYRRLGNPLVYFWSTLIAGTSLIGVSKGVTFATILLPLSLFALPIMEASLGFASKAFTDNAQWNISLYEKLVSMGIDHPQSVRLVAAFCMTLGTSVALFQLIPSPWGLRISLIVLGGGIVAFLAYISRNTAHEDQRRPALWGIFVDNVSLDYVLNKVIFWTNQENDQNYMIVTPNALVAERSRYDRELREAVKSADLSLPDGTGLIWGFRLLGIKIQERITGIDFMKNLCEIARYRELPIFLLGGTAEVVKKASERLMDEYPGLKVAGFHHGYFTEENDKEICEKINESGAKILFVGLGVPKQEIWIKRNLQRFKGIVAIGVGGSFDVISGRLKRAPKVWQNMGLEWLYRTIQEPWRLKRTIRLPLFVILILLTRLGLYSRRIS